MDLADGVTLTRAGPYGSGAASLIPLNSVLAKFAVVLCSLLHFILMSELQLFPFAFEETEAICPHSQ